MIVAQKDGRRIGRIRLGRVANGSAAEIEPFIRSAVEPGTEIETDGNQAYSGLPALGYARRITLMKAAEGDNDRMLPRVHQVPRY